jgi:hypothetical protein
MRRFVLAAGLLAGFGAATAGPALAQGCGGAGGMCALPAGAGQQTMPGMAMPGMPMPGMPMQQTAPVTPPTQQAVPGTGMMGGMGMGMCPCCRQMAMAQPQPGVQGGMGMMGRGGLRPMMPDGGAAAPGGDMGMGMGSTPRPPAGDHHPPPGAPSAQ